MLKQMPTLFRGHIRSSIRDERAQTSFDDLCKWEDGILAAFNALSVAADRMADALEAIEKAPYVTFDSKGDFAAFVRDLAHNARITKGAGV